MSKVNMKMKKIPVEYEEEEEEDDDDEDEDDDEEDDEEEEEDEEEEDEEEEDEDEEDDEDDDDSRKRQKPLNPIQDQLEFDLGYLALSDPRKIESNKIENAQKRDDYLKSIATENMQHLVKQLFLLPKSEGLVNLAELPAPVNRTPRYRPIPQPKVPTKWEKFAKEKGITKKKRERMLYDDVEQNWKPRFGYGRGNDTTLDPIIEVKDGEDYGNENPFAAKKAEKKLRVLKNKEKQLKNMEFAESKKKKAPVPTGIPLQMSGRSYGLGKTGTMEALAKAQLSTASLGKFDKRQKNEPKLKTLVRKRLTSDDPDSDMKLLNRVLNSQKMNAGGGNSFKPAPVPESKARRKKNKRKSGD